MSSPYTARRKLVAIIKSLESEGTLLPLVGRQTIDQIVADLWDVEEEIKLIELMQKRSSG